MLGRWMEWDSCNHSDMSEARRRGTATAYVTVTIRTGPVFLDWLTAL